jgi:hypothetical protein
MIKTAKYLLKTILKLLIGFDNRSSIVPFLYSSEKVFIEIAGT